MPTLSHLALTTALVTLTGSAIMLMILRRTVYFDERTGNIIDDVGMIFALLGLLIVISN